jgi:beta-N-acetylhexosaminidase
LRKQLHYDGDQLYRRAGDERSDEIFYPDGDASVQSLVAGNDMLCLPGDVALSLEKINAALREKRLRWKDYRCPGEKGIVRQVYLWIGPMAARQHSTI